MLNCLLLDTGNGIRDYSADPRSDRKARFIADRLAKYAGQEGCSYIARILSLASSRPTLSLVGLRETLADVRYELDRANEYAPHPLTEECFSIAWEDMEALAA
jgi:hypothetical protein